MKTRMEVFLSIKQNKFIIIRIINIKMKFYIKIQNKLKNKNFIKTNN